MRFFLKLVLFGVDAGVISHFSLACFPLLGGVLAFPSVLSFCLPLCPFSFPFVAWCARLPKGLAPLSSHCTPFAVVSLCWMVFPPLRRSCLPLSPILSDFHPLSPTTRVPRLRACPPCPRSCLPCLPLSPTCVPVLAGVPAFPRSCFRLSPTVSPHACVGWYLRLGWRARLPEP